LALTSGARPMVFRRARLGVALPLAFALGAAAAAFTTLEPHGRALELTVSDTFRGLSPLPEEAHAAVPVPVTVIAIDDRAMQRFGHWPWAWSRLAEVTDLLHELGARLMVMDIEFLERDPDRVVEEVAPDGRTEQRIEKTVPRLVESMRGAGNVLAPFSLYIRGRPGAERGGEAARLAPDDLSGAPAVPAALARHAVSFDCGPAGPAASIFRAEGFQPMLPEIGEACAGSGYTSILHDPEDMKVRRVPLVVRAGEQVFPHLMLETAGLWRFGPGYRTRMAEERFFLESADGKESVSVPVDGHAQVELRWRSLESLKGISIVPFVSAVEDRRRYAGVLAQLDNLFPDEGWSAARRRLDEARRADAAAPTGQAAPAGQVTGPRGGSPDPPRAGQAAAAANVRDLQKALAAIEERLAMNLAAAAGDPAAAQPADQRGRRLRALAAEHLEFLGTYHDPEEGIDALLARLRSRVAGRICIIGHHASGMDLHATPIGIDVPGVNVYPAGVQTILSGVAFRHLPTAAQWAVIILAAGLVVSTLHLSTWRGIAATLVLSVAVVSAAAVASAEATLLLPVAGPVLGIVMAFAGVSAYRQLTEASSRRWLTRAFQQYTGAEHVDELLRDPERLRLGGERREITFLFSDIAGFTTMAEKYQPERLVALLNHYLSAMTEILMAERGALDKYEGDAILAMFGAPIPAHDHALRAVRAALAMRDALPRVNDELVRMGLLAPGTRLAIRIGCATGPAIVGNFGSEQRFNYTAMGDTVNLGSRLEEANRHMRSHVLVPEATAAACGDAVLFRRFGEARIRGKEKPVAIYEPLALEPAPQDIKTAADAFGRAVNALAARDTAAAEAALRELLAARPDDGPAQVLRERIAAARDGRQPPDEPWNLAQPK